VLAAILGSLVVALLGALAGALIAVALTVRAVPDDPFAIVLVALGYCSSGCRSARCLRSGCSACWLTRVRGPSPTLRRT
jgi:hypothetical protein